MLVVWFFFSMFSPPIQVTSWTENGRNRLPFSYLWRLRRPGDRQLYGLKLLKRLSYSMLTGCFQNKKRDMQRHIPFSGQIVVVIYYVTYWFYGGGGGSRTRVRKHSALASSYIAWNFAFACSSLLQAGCLIGYPVRWFANPLTRYRDVIGNVRFLPVDIIRVTQEFVTPRYLATSTPE